MARGKIKDGWCCVKCDLPMESVLLPRYEYEIGCPLHDVEALKCKKCGEVFFTEDQAHAMRDRTEELKEFSFGFVRTVTLSGKSLVVCVPSELADQLKMKQGQKVRIIPIAREGFMVKVGK
ncbi:MAG: hypothetical protein AABX47_02570 [Nanoarchaeota archaeon]